MIWPGTGGVPADTTAEAARVQRAAFAAMAPGERLQQALQLSETTRQLAAAGLRRRLDLKSDEQVLAALIRVCYGEELSDESLPKDESTGGPEIATAEDVLLARLEWAKETGSEQQMRDVVGILSSQGSSLDRAYVEKWVGELGLEDEWSAAQERAR